jgi:hypothetical protein
MNDIEEIRKRINKRKGYRKKQKLNDHHFAKFYNFMIKSMVVLLVLVAVFTYLKVDTGDYISNHIFSKVNLEVVKQWVNNQFYNFFDEEETTVSSDVVYKHVKDNLYTNSSNEVVNFSKGRVIYTGNQSLLGNYVTILLENNIEVTFGKLNDIFVSKFDSVDEASIIGTCDENVMIIFTQGEKEIDYDEFQKIMEN